ncbi:MAG: tail sheath stabilizer and completion protein [Minisyncoccia bacterium]
MFGKHFYHESLRKVVVAFGTIFNNITIHRTDSSGNVVQSLKVPLAYSPKEKFLTRLEQQPNLDNREFSVTLPRMGFEIAGISYDPSRKLQKLGKFKAVKSTSTSIMDYQYNPVPYNISFNLFSFTATAEGGLQIIEQILPYFQPDYTVTINAIPSMGIKRDVPIILNSVSYEDTYDGSYTTRRAVNYTLNFTAKTYLYGPVYSQRVIKETQSDMYSDTPQSSREERIIVVPNPTSADANDDFGFTTTINTFSDAKNYNPASDSDE